MEYQQNNSGQGLGIAGLIIGILAIILSIIPCTAIFGLFLGIIGMILSIIGIIQASKTSSEKGLVIAALVVSIIGVLIAGLWGIAFTKMAKENHVLENFYKFNKQYKKINNSIDEFDTELDNLDSLEFESNKTMNELEQDMEKLENTKPARLDSIENNNN